MINTALSARLNIHINKRKPMYTCTNDSKWNGSVSKTPKKLRILWICALVGRMAHVWTAGSTTIKSKNWLYKKTTTKNKQTKKQTKKTINYWLIEVKIKKTIRSSSLFSCVLPPTTFHSVSKALPVEQEHRYVKSTQDQTKNK